MNNAFLKGEKIYLRTITQDDLNANYREWFNDEEVTRYNSHHRFPNYDENMYEYFERVIKSHENLVLAICDSATDAHIGNVALENINSLERNAEFAIILGDKDFWGKGVGSEAARLIIDHGFTQLNLHRIYCGTSEDNIAMQKMAHALGFKEEGQARDAMYKNGSFKQVLLFGLLENEWKK